MSLQDEAGLALVPKTLRQTYAGWRWRVAGRYRAAAAVFRLEPPAGEARFLKVLAVGPRNPSPLAEAERLRWARAYLPVPDVVDAGSDGGVEWLLTTGLPGTDATAGEHLARPRATVAALARGLRRLHEAAPVGACRFDFRLDAALALVRRRAAEGLIDAQMDLHPEHAGLTVEQAIERLEVLRPAAEDLVVCHGDYCFPNALLVDGEVTGYLDLGELGVADRWWDVAVGAWSASWNVGPGYEDVFYEAYGVAPDPARIAFYRLLYDLAS